MRWSYADLMATPTPVVEELTRWMREQHDEQLKEANEQARTTSLPRHRGRRR